MSRSLSKVNDQIRCEIFVTDNTATAITGLANGAFTKLLSKNGSNDTTTVTVTEIASGRYTVTFTPTAIGMYELTVLHATYNPFGWTETFDVTTDGSLTSAQITTAVPTVVQIRAEMDSNSTKLASILSGITSLASDVANVLVDVAAVPAAVWDYVVGVSYTAKRYLKAIGAAVAGKTSGGAEGFTARDLEDTQDQVVGTADSSGNRTPTSYGS